MEFDSVCLEKGLVCVDGDLAHVVRGMFGKVGVPHVVV